MSTPTKLVKWIDLVLWMAGFGVLTANIFLVRQNRRLLQLAAPQITAGTELHTLAGLNLDGRLEVISLPPKDSKLLIITFSPGCPACQANQEGWTKLARVLEHKGVHVLWMSRDPIDMTREYCVKHSIPLSDTVADPPHRTYLELGLARVPNTLLVGDGGKVEKVWAGRLDSAGWTALFAYFGGQKEESSQSFSALAESASACGSENSETKAKSCK